jgi:hypothetical protein
MKLYRLYCLDGAGKIERAEWIEAENDDEAEAIVFAKKLCVPCEIWERGRLVARIPYPQARSVRRRGPSDAQR